jgi:cytochrome P450
MSSAPVWTGDPAEFNSPEFFSDPYPLLKRLRELGPIVRIGERSHLAVGFDAVYDILRNHEQFSSDASSLPEDARGGDGDGMQIPIVLITDDPPRHTRFRGLVNRAFTPRRVAELEPFARTVVDDLLDDFPEGEVDLVPQLSVPLPVTMIATLLGIPPERGDDFKRWSNALIAAQRGEFDLEDLGNMINFLNSEIASRREAATADLITALAEAEVDGERLEDWEVLGFTILLLVAGNETTTNLIGNMLNVLADRPELWQRLRDDRSLVEPFIEETLRIDSPVQVLFRYSKEAVTVDGVDIPAGVPVNVAYGAANRDPKAYDRPDEFDLERDDDAHHVAFGMGIHYCLGSPLARLEARVALERLLDRYAALERGEAPAQRQTSATIVRGFAHLPLRFTPA